jgi:rubrerythrin
MKLLNGNSEKLPYRYIKPEHFGLAEETLRSVFIKGLKDAIKSEAKAIDDYNILLGICDDLINLHIDYNISEIRKIIEEIKADETDHYEKLTRISHILV